MSEFEWVSRKEGFQKALKYIDGRSKGVINSVLTPWPKFNDATTNGLEWNTLSVIGGRPGSFKTGLKDQIIREAFRLNPLQRFRVLEFSFEMIMQTSCLRDFSSVLGKSYKYLCSAEGNKLTQAEIAQCYEIAKDRVNFPIDIVEDPCTVNEMRDIIEKYIHEYQTPTIITIDHSVLFIW
jgi:replicative DNA helicase